MTDHPESFHGTAELGARKLGTTRHRPEADLIGDVLRALRIEGTLLLREAYRAPFRVAVPSAVEIERMMGVAPGARAVAFHLAERGSFELRRDAGAPLGVESGEIVLAVGGQPHELAQGQVARAVEFSELLDGAAERPCGFAPSEEAGPALITCGALVFAETHLNPLFDSLPDMLTIRARAGEGERRIGPLLSILLAELAIGAPGVDYVVERLLELLCAEGIRAYAAEHASDVGWFRAVADDAVGRALRAFHAAPGRSWSVTRLAEVAHLSPSRFAARFVEATGIAAMTYVARWRLNLAMRALSGTDQQVSELAYDLGYESSPAFSRAFKKYVGSSPTAYRKKVRGLAGNVPGPSEMGSPSGD